MGKDWPAAPLPSRGRPRVPAPVLGTGMLVLGLAHAFWLWVGGKGSLPSPPPEVPWLSLFCQGDLFNHLIFWWPFIPCFHGYGPIKGRSNKAASQTGNKNIKAHVHRGRAGGGQGLSEVRRPGGGPPGLSPRDPPELLASGLGLGLGGTTPHAPAAGCALWAPRLSASLEPSPARGPLATGCMLGRRAGRRRGSESDKSLPRTGARRLGDLSAGPTPLSRGGGGR